MDCQLSVGQLLLRGREPSSNRHGRGAQLNRRGLLKPAATFILLLGLAFASAAGDKPAMDWSALAAKSPDALPVVLEQLKVRKILRLDPFATWDNPKPNATLFHEWVVSGSSALSDKASREALIRSMRVIVDSPRDPGDGVPACFEPHHGAILSDGRRTFEVVICFKCSRYNVYTPDGKLAWGGTFTTVKSEGPVWDEIFGAATMTR